MEVDESDVAERAAVESGKWKAESRKPHDEKEAII
jgi:hypothetical protein